MIFVVLGTQKFQCNRLLKKIDVLLDSEVLTEDVIAQIGQSDYKPKNYKYVDFLEKDEFEKKIVQCSVLITHGGVGTILSGINHNKPVIVFPRLKKYGEHVDDHQMEIAAAFLKKNFVLVCGDNNDLGKIIDESRIHKFDKYISQRSMTIEIIREHLKEI